MREPFVPADPQLRELLANARTIAVVGISDDPSRPSHDVAEYLVRAGYDLIPVNPGLKEWNGRKSYPDLQSVARSGIAIDIADVFRRSEYVAGVVDDAIAAQAKAVWLQLGVIDEAAAQKAQRAGLTVVMDRCSKVEHRRLVH